MAWIVAALDLAGSRATRVPDLERRARMRRALQGFLLAIAQAGDRRVCAHFGGGGTRQVGLALTLPDVSIAKTAASPVPKMCTVTAPAEPFELPIFAAVGVRPFASVYLMTVPDGYGPKTVPLPRSRTNTWRSASR